jgi:hypothetical protein
MNLEKNLLLDKNKTESKGCASTEEKVDDSLLFKHPSDILQR